MSVVTLLPMLVPLLGGLIASLRSDPAAAVEATPYVITFETGRDTLARDSASTRQLAVLRDLLVRHGRRPALGFVVTGFVPPDCSDGRCPQAELLRRRVQVLVAALQAQWPSRAEPLPLDRLRWLALPRSGEPGRSEDQVRLLLEGKPAAAANDCPLLEVADPALPAVVDAPGKAPWIAVASGATTRSAPRVAFASTNAVRSKNRSYGLRQRAPGAGSGAAPRTSPTAPFTNSILTKPRW